MNESQDSSLSCSFTNLASAIEELDSLVREMTFTNREILFQIATVDFAFQVLEAAKATLLLQLTAVPRTNWATARLAFESVPRKHREWHVLKTCPGLGPIRTAELLPVVVTPYRFQSRSRFWAYCGLGVVMRSSSDWVRGPGGRWVREPVQQTRGLNRNFNHTLKRVFKGAATTVIGRAENEPLYRHYERLLEGGTKPNLAKLTIARQLASIVLAVWRTGEAYDPKRLEATE